MDIALLRSYAEQGMTRQQISEKIGLSYSRTTTLLRKNAINVKRKPYVNTKPIKPHVQRALDLRKEGLSYKQIAKILEAPWERIANACRDHGLGGAIIEQRLTESQVADYVSRSGFDYVSGYQSQKKPITVRCRQCGRTFERQFHIFRDVATGTWQCGNECPLCRADRQADRQVDRERKKEEERQTRRVEAEREAQMKAQQRAEQLSRKVNDQLARRLAIHVCKNCGTDFCIESTGYNSDAYCSSRCQKRWHERIKNEKRMDKLKERPHDTDITLERLFKRDGGVCYICGCQCDWSDIVEKDGTMIAGDHYPSVDHVKPVSKGGTHTWDNIRLACRACNTLKGWN